MFTMNSSFEYVIRDTLHSGVELGGGAFGPPATQTRAFADRLGAFGICDRWHQPSEENPRPFQKAFFKGAYGDWGSTAGH
jgi:hypothetical protein